MSAEPLFEERPLSFLKILAAKVLSLPHGEFPSVALGFDSREAVDRLESLGGKRHAAVSMMQIRFAPAHPLVIEHVELLVDGVTFTAQFSRKPTPTELLRLEAKEGSASATRTGVVSARLF